MKNTSNQGAEARERQRLVVVVRGRKLPGSKKACWWPMDTLRLVARLTPDKETPRAQIRAEVRSAMKCVAVAFDGVFESRRRVFRYEQKAMIGRTLGDHTRLCALVLAKHASKKGWSCGIESIPKSADLCLVFRKTPR